MTDVMSFDLDTCKSKDELEQFARVAFDVELDKRKKMADLKAQVKALMSGKSEPAKAEKKDKPAVTCKYVKNANDVVFPYHDQLAKRVNVDLIPCDKDGKAV